MQHGRHSGGAWRVAAGVLLALGALLRLLGAWWYRSDGNPDFGIVALMVKHIVEGRGVPVFFYGQPYMGTFEPLVSAACAAALGWSGFSVCLGTALVGFLILPVVYLWARELGGPKAGVAALACVVLAPATFLQYMASSRGGYPTAILAGAFVMWQTSVILRAAAGGREVTPVRFLALGVVAGVGWWTTPMVAPALAASALLLTIGAPRLVLAWRPVAVGVAGFLLGSAPFWGWNATHDWESFRYFSAFKSTPFGKGVRILFSDRLDGLLELQDVPAWRRVGVLGLCAAGVVLGVIAAVRRGVAGGGWKGEGGGVGSEISDLKSLPAALSPFVFLVVSIAVSSVSFFVTLNTPRYLLPLVPALAVAFGMGTAMLARRLPWGLGWIPLALLLVHQGSGLGAHRARAARDAAYHERVAELGSLLRREQICTVYVPFFLHSLNYMLNEAFCFSDPKGERYTPYARQAETDDGIAVMNRYGGLGEFLAQTGGDCRRGGMKWFGLCDQFRPPTNALAELGAGALAAVTSGGADARGVLGDDRYDTVLAATPEQRIEVTLAATQRVCAVRFTLPEGVSPSELAVDTRDSGASGWQAVECPGATTPYFWSGPRPYWGGMGYRIERRFEPRQAAQLRVTLRWDGIPPGAGVCEVQVFGPAGPNRPGRDDVGGLAAALRARGVRRLYADRWEANAVWRELRGRVATTLDPAAFRSVETALGSRMRLTADTALLSRVGDADMCRRVLGRAGVQMRETGLGPWVLFDFGGERPWRDGWSAVSGLRWIGFGCQEDKSL